MSWSIDPKETGSINDGGSRLPIGKSTHEITNVSRPVNSQNPSGNEQQVLIETVSGGSSYKIYLNPESPTESVANIAKKTLVGFWQAAGLTEAIKPERLKKLIGKNVELEVAETEGKKGTKNEGKTFTNIRKVNPASEVEEEEEEQEDSENEEQEEQEEAPAEAAPAGKKELPWKTKKK